ncbi:DDE-type integrase/transposase/recombinase [Streptomyces mirabilis]|uniref:DDE-type integrase/transposase/recombinase n=1 Tax=Streptomyces mirabilis TaxID=68239 RepID=UPI003648C22B
MPWVADVTHIRTFSGWVYAAFVIDVFSRMVVGWQLAGGRRQLPGGVADRVQERLALGATQAP